MALNQASDQVVWSIVRKQNSRARPETSYGIKPFFTRESGNLLQRSVFKHSGYRRQTVGVSRRTRKTKGRRQRKSHEFTLVFKKSGKTQKPAQSRRECVVQGAGSTRFARRQIRAQTSYRLYRNDLTKLALKRLMKVKNHQNRYSRRRRAANKRRAQRKARPSKKGGDEEDAAAAADGDMDIID